MLCDCSHNNVRKLLIPIKPIPCLPDRFSEKHGIAMIMNAQISIPHSVKVGRNFLKKVLLVKLGNLPRGFLYKVAYPNFLNRRT